MTPGPPWPPLTQAKSRTTISQTATVALFRTTANRYQALANADMNGAPRQLPGNLRTRRLSGKGRIVTMTETSLRAAILFHFIHDPIGQSCAVCAVYAFTSIRIRGFTYPVQEEWRLCNQFRPQVARRSKPAPHQLAWRYLSLGGSENSSVASAVRTSHHHSCASASSPETAAKVMRFKHVGPFSMYLLYNAPFLRTM